MTLVAPLLGLSLVAGALRAVVLWRASSQVGAVNAVVLGVVGRGRVGDLASVLEQSGPALYVAVAAEIGAEAGELRAAASAVGIQPRELREQIERVARVALIRAHRRLRRESWLGTVAVAGMGFVSVSLLVAGQVSSVELLGLVAAALLWVSNVWGARSIAGQLDAGAEALVDGLLVVSDA